MFRPSWLRSLLPRHPSTARLKPTLEALEDRCVPAILLPVVLRATFDDILPAGVSYTYMPLQDTYSDVDTSQHASDPPAEVFHQLLEHRWYLSQNQKRNVPLAEALTSYIDDVLRHRRDEVTVVGPPTGSITAAIDVVDDEEDWRSKV